MFIPVALQLLILAASPAGAGPEPNLDQLRRAYCEKFCEPAPHVALARAVHDRGQRLTAFFILEGARRRFSREEPGAAFEGNAKATAEKDPFDRAFEETFLGKEPFDNSPRAEAALRKKLEKEPQAPKLLEGLADIHIPREEYDEARKLLERLLELDPDNLSAASALVEVLRRKEDTAALDALKVRFSKNHPASRVDCQLRFESLLATDPKAARELIEAALRKHPDDGELLFDLGVIQQQAKDLDGAESTFLKAAGLAKTNAHVQGWVGRFLLKVRSKEAPALEQYLSAYFLDPHFYDSEYAESRIRKLAFSAAKARIKDLNQKGTSPGQMLKETHPVVVDLALDELGKAWKAEYTEPVLALLSHDDESLRWKVTELLRDHAGPALEGIVRKLVKDPDHRRRGAAAYLAMAQKKDRAIPELVPWLNLDSQLLRFDVLSAFAESGSSRAREALEQHLPREKQAYLRKVLESVLAKGR